ncbi:MAG: hypothetical protein F6J93_28240 [Oscillatoria sp. SIO1A7]|nr:hypothetical protein [Oscillatoria sp. SIO1A7]
MWEVWELWEVAGNFVLGAIAALLLLCLPLPLELLAPGFLAPGGAIAFRGLLYS